MGAFSCSICLFLFGLFLVLTQVCVDVHQSYFQQPLTQTVYTLNKCGKGNSKRYNRSSNVVMTDVVPKARIYPLYDFHNKCKQFFAMHMDIRDIGNINVSISNDTSAELLNHPKLRCHVSSMNTYHRNIHYRCNGKLLIFLHLLISSFCLFTFLRYFLFESITGKCNNSILGGKYSFPEGKYTENKSAFFNAYNWMLSVRFRTSSMNKVIAYPFSLNEYVEDIVQHHRSTEELMKYEWSRYLSFKTFPLDSVMTPMRLAQAGFYYTGNRQEVKCFSCGMTNDSWTTDETAIQVHKRMSPNCEFIRGGETQNVTIHCREYYDRFNETSGQNETVRGARWGSGATGGLSCVQTSMNRNTAENNENQQILAHHNKPDSINRLESANGKYKQQRAAHSTNVSERQSAKHPDYKDLAARIGSFCTWTYTSVQDPLELAQAGFFFTGVKDFVRCYFCGIGLKNWDSGDNPWTEHTHWSQSCGHLVEGRSTMGGRNVQSALQTMPHPQASHNSIINERLASATPDVQISLTANGDSDTREIDMATENVDKVMESDEVRKIMDMGYTRDTVRAAVRKYLDSSQIVDTVNTESVVEIILESDLSGVSSPSTSDNERVPEGSDIKQEIDTQKQALKASNPIKGLRTLKEKNMLLREQMLCKICLDRDADTVFLPCGHMVACRTCALSLKKCAICRKHIKGTVLVYKC